MRISMTIMCLFWLMTPIIVAGESPVDQGSMILAGSFDFSVTGGEIVDDEPLVVFRLQPTLGYFVAPGLMIGGQFHFETASQDENTATLFGIGPIAGYYFGANNIRSQIKGSAYPYIRGQFSYSKMSTDGSYGYNTFEVGGGIGVVFMISSTIGLDLGGNYNYISQNFDTDWYDKSETGYRIFFGGGISAFIY